MGSYRRNDANDPDVYVQAITLVLSDYPRAIVEYVTDPRCGIQANEKFRTWPPNAGEVKEACEERVRASQRPSSTESVRRFVKWNYVRPPNFPGRRANVHVLKEAPQYADLVAWSRTEGVDQQDWVMTDRGIKVALSVWQNFGRLMAPKTMGSKAQAVLRESLARAAGQEPAEEMEAP